jgi:hypothetical protein
MKTLTIGNNTYEIVDEVARKSIGALEDSVPTQISDAISGITPENIGASPTTHEHTKSEITDFPASMPASDVYEWAKASVKPTYTADEVGAVKKTGDTITGDLVLNKGTEMAQYKIAQSDSNGVTHQTEYAIDISAEKTCIKYRVGGSVTNALYLNKDDTSLTKPLTIPSGGTGVTTVPALMALVNNSYNVNLLTNDTDLFSLPTGIYHCENETSTDYNFPIAETRATIEIFGQYRTGTSASDGYPNGYWTIRITYASGKQFTNHRYWSNWSGWKVTYNSASVICSDSEPTNPFAGQIWLKPI